MKGNAAASFALVAAVLAACGSAYAGPLPIEAIPPASGELTTLADLVVMLKRELQAVEQRLVAECDAVEARDHFADGRGGGSEVRQPRCSIQPFASSDRADPPATGRRLQIDVNDGESAGENR